MATIQPKRLGANEVLTKLDQSFESLVAFIESGCTIRNYESGFINYGRVDYSQANVGTPFMDAVGEIMGKIIFQDGKVVEDAAGVGHAIEGTDLAVQIKEKQHELINYVARKFSESVCVDIIEGMFTGKSFTTSAASFFRPKLKPGETDKFTDIRQSGNYGAFLEQGMLGALRHGSKPTPDEEEIGLEAKEMTSENVRPPLTQNGPVNYTMKGQLGVGGGQIRFHGFTRGELTWEEISDPMIRITFTLMKMIRKMNNLLFVSVQEEEGSYMQGTLVATLSFKAIILFTELYMRKLINLVTKSLVVTAKQALPKYDYGWEGGMAMVDWQVYINFNEGSLLAGVKTLTELYLSNVGLLTNSTFNGDDAFRNALFGLMRNLSGWGTMPDSGLNV